MRKGIKELGKDKRPKGSKTNEKNGKNLRVLNL